MIRKILGIRSPTVTALRERQHRCIPGCPFLFQTGKKLGFAIFQIGSLTRIADNVEEKFVLPDFQIFVIAIEMSVLVMDLVTPEQ